MPANAVTEIRCRRAEEIPSKNNQQIRGSIHLLYRIVGRRGEDYEEKVQQAVVLKKQYSYVQYHTRYVYTVRRWDVVVLNSSLQCTSWSQDSLQRSP